jgi:hypothetical protein
MMELTKIENGYYAVAVDGARVGTVQRNRNRGPRGELQASTSWGWADTEGRSDGGYANRVDAAEALVSAIAWRELLAARAQGSQR